MEARLGRLGRNRRRVGRRSWGRQEWGSNPATRLGPPQQSANLANKRINDLNSYTTKYKTDVYFGNDQIALTSEAKTSLDNIASEARATNAYMIQVAAYASTSGSAQLNEELSNQRADAVIAFLTQSGHIPIYRILSPAAMGASTAAGSDAALNRRVVVKVVVNEGIAQ